MGLDTSHDCWHGAYSAFSRWRDGLAKAAGVPLDLMVGYYRTDSGVSVSPPPEDAMDWARPREGGPQCGSYYGPMFVRYVERVDSWLPLQWESLRPDVLHILLDHSDCDGLIGAQYCEPLANRLEELLPLLPTEVDPGHIGVWQEKTQRFIDGLRLAAAQGEDVEFH